MKKWFLGLLAALAAAAAIAFAVVVTHPAQQMSFMADYVMGNIRDYHWSALKKEDPVTPALETALGEERSESIAAFYGYLKGAAGEMTWEITEIDPAQLTAQVEVTYPDGLPFLTAYAEGLGDYILSALDSGTMQLSQAEQVLDFIPEEDNAALIAAAAQQKGEQLSTTVTVHFNKKMGLYLPQNVSGAVNDAASAGLFSRLDVLSDLVAQRLIPGVVERTFGALVRFDEAELSALTGKSMSEMLGISEDSPLYAPFVGYLRSCAGKLEYTVGEYDPLRRCVKVECSFLDSENIIQRYLRSAAAYLIAHLFDGGLTDEANAMLLQNAIDEAEEERVEKTVTITFNGDDYSDFTVSEEIEDVVSANLRSELNELLAMMK